MKKVMLLLPLIILLAFLAVHMLLPAPQYYFALKTDQGNPDDISDFGYRFVMSDGTQRWDVSGKGDTITYTTSFLKEQETIQKEEPSQDAFFLYLPSLPKGKTRKDYTKGFTKTIEDERYSEPVKVTYYDVDQVGMDVMVKTDKGYACFPSGLTRRYEYTRDSLVYHHQDQQLYFQNDPQRAGRLKGSGIRHPYVLLKGRTLVALYDDGQGSSGPYRIYEIESAYPAKTMPDVSKAKAATKVKPFLTLEKGTQAISDMIVYQNRLYVAYQKQGKTILYIYDEEGKLLAEEKLGKQTFHRFEIQNHQLMVVTSYQDTYRLKVYDDETLVKDIQTKTDLSMALLQLKKDHVYALDLKQLDDLEYRVLEVTAFDAHKTIVHGYVKGDFLEDVQASQYYRKLETGELMPEVQLREIQSFSFD